jgi:NAD(P)H dehydrogenase (quinone)
MDAAYEARRAGSSTARRAAKALTCPDPGHSLLSRARGLGLNPLDHAEERSMAKILVLYYSSYGHMEQMAYAAAEGVRHADADAEVKRVPELVPEETARKSGMKLDQPAPIATVDELPGFDGLILGIPTRYGRMPSQLASFLDRTGRLWATNALVGKVGAVMSSTATQHGGQETTQITGIVNLLHLGFVVVGLPYSYAGQMTLDEVTGGSPYGASTIAGGRGERQPSANELGAARFQGKLVGQVATRLAGGA